MPLQYDSMLGYDLFYILQPVVLQLHILQKSGVHLLLISGFILASFYILS